MHVILGNSLKPLLASRVPENTLYSLSLDVELDGFLVNAYGGRLHIGFDLLVSEHELPDNASLAHVLVAHEADVDFDHGLLRSLIILATLH